MKKYKKHEGEIKKFAESNNRLSREVEHLTQMLAAADDCKRWAYEQLLKANQEIIKIERERRESGSIFTVSKREEFLERRLKSECLKSEELAEKLQTLQVRYDEAVQAVKELTDRLETAEKENEQLKARLEHFNTVERRAQFECARANELEEKLEKSEKEVERLKNQRKEMTIEPISREQAEEIFFNGEEKKGGENDA